MMARMIGFLAILVALVSSPPQGSRQPAAIPGVVSADAAVELVKEGFVFTEGPVGTADGGIYRDGRLYVTTATGIQVFDNAGLYVGTIRVPRQPSNVAFGGPNKRKPYITAREGLYQLQMLSQGPDRPGK